MNRNESQDAVTRPPAPFVVGHLIHTGMFGETT
jgi:hypothetical protein